MNVARVGEMVGGAVVSGDTVIGGLAGVGPVAAADLELAPPGGMAFVEDALGVVMPGGAVGQKDDQAADLATHRLLAGVVDAHLAALVHDAGVLGGRARLATVGQPDAVIEPQRRIGVG